jgi:Dolichyl-phosphate-mannose-protein mannosyltransferase
MPSPAAATLATTPARRWRPSLTGSVAAGVTLACFWILLLASVRQKSLTSDEIAHAAAGYSYWRFDDYRLNPENGNLPQRVMGLGLALAPGHFPSLATEAWSNANEWQVGDQWFHHSGNDVTALLFHGRAAMALLAVILGAVVWGWSRRLFGPRGGMVSLLLFALSPIILANGPLMTSDTCAALFFLAAVGTGWRLLQKITLTRILAGGLCLGGLFVSKMSAPLIAPIALALLTVRLIDGRPLPIGAQLVIGRSRQAVVLAMASLAPIAIAWAVIWAAYGFRYTAFAPAAGPGHFADRWESVLGQPDPLSLVGRLDLSAGQQDGVMRILHARDVPLEAWQPQRLAALEEIRQGVLTPAQERRLAALAAAPSATPLARLVGFLRRRHGLPEAYLYGQLSAWKYSQLRASFLNGEISLHGWWWFFPYTFLVKTPLACFGIGGLALAAALRRRPIWPGLYATAPLWALLACYGTAVLGSHLNIGHRHILTLYPPLFVLCGAAAGLGDSGRSRRAWTLALGCLLAALAADVLGRFPNYLAYFNALAGGQREGYRHLVDSSLDWGQDLPGVKAYLARETGTGPVYFSYFGTGSPRSYSISAQRLYSFAGNDVPPPVRILNPPVGQEDAAVAEALRLDPGYEVVARAAPQGGQVPILLLKSAAALRLAPGTYLISATMLQPLAYDFSGPLGPWNERYEALYQNLAATVRPLLSGDARTRRAGLTERTPEDWAAILPRFEMFRFARLTAYLRRRIPDDLINDSILVYHLSAADLARALEGPPPELGLDLLQRLPLAPSP